MRPEDKFYFYHSSIGDLSRIIKRNVLQNVESTSGFITNAFGVKIRPEFFPGFLEGKEGVDPPPIPANWHADMAEFAAALRAIELSKKTFTALELGCGWGCWLNISGVVAKRKGLKVNLIGVEGDSGHVDFALTALSDNEFQKSEYVIHHGIAATASGTAMFPVQDKSGASWGLGPVFDAEPEVVKEMLEKGTHEALDQVSLDSVASNHNRIDLLHVDIQGGEIPLIPEAIDFLNSRVAMILIGTHSRVIEGELFKTLTSNDWRLEIERPAVISVGIAPETLIDGVQLWRNPRVISDELACKVEPKGSVKSVNLPAVVKGGEKFELEVEVTNDSTTDWISEGDYPVRLSYHWNHKGKPVQYEGIRTIFSEMQLNSGDTKRQLMTIEAPSFKGDCELVITIVQDGFFWFENCGFSAYEAKLSLC